MKADIKANQTPDAILIGTAEAVLDAIKAEPVPAEIMDLAMQLQAKFSEQKSSALERGATSDTGED